MNPAETPPASVHPSAATQSGETQPHLNFDAMELAKFSDLAHNWWDPNAEFKPLHALNPLRLDWIHQTTGGLSGKNVLDVGCGGGILSDSMARRGATVLGIDLSAKALRVAQLHALEVATPNVTYREITAEALAEEVTSRGPNALFDVVTCMEMLEHVPDPASVVAACARMVKPGGWVFFSTINRRPKAWFLAVVGAEYLLNLLPKGTHDYAKFITPAELASSCRKAHLAVVQVRGMQHNPLTGRFWLNDDASVNYSFATKLIA